MSDWVKDLKAYLNKYDALDKFCTSLIDPRVCTLYPIEHVPVKYVVSSGFSWSTSAHILGEPTEPWIEISQVWYGQTKDNGYGKIGMSRAELADLLKDTPTKRLLSYVRSKLAP